MLRVASLYLGRLVGSRSTLSAPVRSPIWTALTTWIFAVLLPVIFGGFYTSLADNFRKLTRQISGNNIVIM